MPDRNEQYRSRQELSATEIEQIGRLIAPLLLQQIQPELEKITDNLTSIINKMEKKVELVEQKLEKHERYRWHITGLAAGVGSVLGVAIGMLRDWYFHSGK